MTERETSIKFILSILIKVIKAEELAEIRRIEELHTACEGS
jgi:hypothetical protein